MLAKLSTKLGRTVVTWIATAVAAALARALVDRLLPASDEEQAST